MNVVPIPPSYNEDQSLSLKDTEFYIKWLDDQNCTAVMTTAGTSQFNLLSTEEIKEFNSCVSDFSAKKIIGLPPLSLNSVIQFVKSCEEVERSHWMALYPDRYYDDDSIVDYFARIREHTNKAIYVHGMFTRSGYGGTWNYTADVLNKLWDQDIICGIKEEHSDLAKAFNVLNKCPKDLDVIVAGGSMRRHQFLKNAGANSFLAGIGNIFPSIEQKYCDGVDIDKCLQQESTLFSTFGKYGWHRSLRIGLALSNLCCYNDRMPYPKRETEVVNAIKKVLEKISNV